MYDTVFYQKFLNTEIGLIILIVFGFGLALLIGWVVYKLVEKTFTN
jgi:peptidoglycan/LPS O-acetylase OafA/YrhL